MSHNDDWKIPIPQRVAHLTFHLSILFTRVRSAIGGLRDHAMDSSRFHPMLVVMPRCLHIEDVWEHSPTRKKKWENAIALPPQSYNHGPLTRGPSNCQPLCHVASLTSVRVDPRGHAWPPAMCLRPMRHLHLARATRGPATWPQCHVASALWSSVPHQLVRWSRLPRQLLWVSKPFFLRI